MKKEIYGSDLAENHSDEIAQEGLWLSLRVTKRTHCLDSTQATIISMYSPDIQIGRFFDS